MRIAAISDIHGNLRALDAVLADIKRRGADVTVNLGDILSGPLQPTETANRLMALDLPTIRGNHERQVLTYSRGRMGPSDGFAADSLSETHKAWLASLPTELRLDGDVLLCHGTPHDDLTYFLETVAPDGWRAATRAEADERAGDARASLILCGHTHMPRVMRLSDGRLVVNPGSVGLQAFDDSHPYPHVIQTGSPHARYALVERVGAGWSVELIAVPYDSDSAAALARSRGAEAWARGLEAGTL